MKKITALLTIVSIATVVSIAHANKNKDAAEAYCKKLREEGKQCKVSAWAGCGMGWTKLKSFRGRGKDYFVCQKISDSVSKKKDSCEKFCTDYRASKKEECQCFQATLCPVGYKKAKFWGGAGDNYVACKRNWYGKKTDQRENDCSKWCSSNCERCDYCMVGNSCRREGDKTLKRFAGPGRNYVACSERKGSFQSRCEAWKKKECPGCTCKAGNCGSGYAYVRTFGCGSAADWSACRKK